MLTSEPFDDLRTLIAQLPEADKNAADTVEMAGARKPFAEARGLLGLAAWLASWQRKDAPTLAEPHICLLASSYAHVPEGALMAKSYIDMCAKGRAPVNLLCVDRGVGLRVIEMAPEVPHKLDGAWSDRDCMAAIAFGMEAAAAGGDILGLTDFAPGNDVPVLALIAYCKGLDLTQMAAGSPLLAAAAQMAAGLTLPENQPLSALRLMGGREVAGAVGALLAARLGGLPVLVDGWAGLGAIAVLEALAPGAAAHVRLASAADDAQGLMADALGLQPLVGTPVGVGAGCGVAAALPILAAAVALLGVPDRRA